MDIMQFVVDHQEEIAAISVKESGKTRHEAISGEVLPTCEKIRYICSAGEAALAEESRTVSFCLSLLFSPLASINVTQVPALLFLKKASVRYYPLGVIGCIVPGNFPFHNAVSHITTAIFGGNAAVIKASEWGALSRSYVQRMYNTVLARRGHDVNLVSVIPGFGETGAALISGGVDKILFIGSPATGQRVMKVRMSGGKQIACFFL
jgi:acyl-CoA reductase-like NAD-dependent aldehyde dehydrogenase